MNYIVLDLEWNQAADLKTKIENQLLFEIIEVGAVKLNEYKQQTDSFHELIKPQVFHIMNQITGELVHLSIDQLDNCRSFKEVVSDFIKWCGEDYIFCTWGNLDLLELQRNMDYYNMPQLADGPIKYYDVQKLFSIAFEDKKLRRTLEFAVDYLNIEKDIAFHRADSDAYYTAKVLQKIQPLEVFINYSFDTYRTPETKKDEIHIVFDDYEKYISRAFENKIEAMSDKEVISTKCYLCKSRTKKKIQWFTSNGKHYYSVFVCGNHGMFKSKIRIKKNFDNNVYVIKTTKKIGDSDYHEIINKREHARELRKERRHKASKEE